MRTHIADDGPTPLGCMLNALELFTDSKGNYSKLPGFGLDDVEASARWWLMLGGFKQ